MNAYSLNEMVDSMRFDYLHQSLLENSNIEIALRYYDEILTTRNLSKQPVAVSLTMDLLRLIKSETINYEALALQMVRGLNQIIDLNQNTRINKSFSTILKNFNLDPKICDFVSETRHSIIHKQFPSKLDIEFCSVFVFVALKEKFWEATVYKNNKQIDSEKLSWMIDNANAVFSTNYKTDEILNTHSNRTASKINLSNNQKAENKLIKAIQRETISLEDLFSICKNCKVKGSKIFVLTVLLENLYESGINEEVTQLTQDILQRNINISEMRNGLKNSRLRKAVIKLLAKPDRSSEETDIISIFQLNFKKLLKKDRIGKIADKLLTDEEKQEFDKEAYNQLENRYNKYEVIEKLSSYK